MKKNARTVGMGLAGLGSVILMLIVAGGNKEKPGQEDAWREITGQTAQINWAVKYYDEASTPDEMAMREMVEERMARTLRALSQWDPNSEILSWNRIPGPATLVVSPELRLALETALKVADVTNGAFDPTYASGRPGSFRDLSLKGNTVISREQVPLDVTAVMEGVFLDGLVEDLAAVGLKRYLVSWGGEFRAVGDGPDGDGWVIGWEAPAPGLVAQDLRQICLRDEAWSVSGNYRDFVINEEGQVTSGLVDGRFGQVKPTTRFFSVGVRAATAREADAWATACAILGEEEFSHVKDQVLHEVIFRELDLPRKTP